MQVLDPPVLSSSMAGEPVCQGTKVGEEKTRAPSFLIVGGCPQLTLISTLYRSLHLTSNLPLSPIPRTLFPPFRPFQSIGASFFSRQIVSCQWLFHDCQFTTVSLLGPPPVIYITVRPSESLTVLLPLPAIRPSTSFPPLHP